MVFVSPTSALAGAVMAACCCDSTHRASPTIRGLLLQLAPTSQVIRNAEPCDWNRRQVFFLGDFLSLVRKPLVCGEREGARKENRELLAAASEGRTESTSQHFKVQSWRTVWIPSRSVDGLDGLMKDRFLNGPSWARHSIPLILDQWPGLLPELQPSSTTAELQQPWPLFQSPAPKPQSPPCLSFSLLNPLVTKLG